MPQKTSLPDIEAPSPALTSPFILTLVKQWRALDSHGVWEKKSDEELIAPYIVTKVMRRSMPIIADPDARTLQRIELFYNAVSICVEERTGISAMPVIKMHHEGFGRILLLSGRLAILSRTVRDAHRFGFETFEALADEGEKSIESSAEMIRTFPEIANYGN